MAYEVIPEPGEEVVAEIDLAFSDNDVPFCFAVSNQAIYIPRKKFYAKTDPYYYERVLLSQVRYLAVKRLRPYWAWIAASLMIPFGLFTLYWMIEPMIGKKGGSYKVSGYPLAIIIGGLLLPIAAKGRFGLEIWFTGGTYRWQPPMVIGGNSKQRIADTFKTLVEGCQSVGITVTDQREH